MGYRVEAISDVADCPAARHCDRLHVGDYADTAFLTAAAANLDVVTFEFENVPAAAGAALAAVVPVRPHPDVLHALEGLDVAGVVLLRNRSSYGSWDGQIFTHGRPSETPNLRRISARPAASFPHCVQKV